MQFSFGFLTFQITGAHKYQFLLFKTQFLNTAPDPADPPEMEHELQLATHQQRAGGQDDGSLNKLPQIIWCICCFSDYLGNLRCQSFLSLPCDQLVKVHSKSSSIYPFCFRGLCTIPGEIPRGEKRMLTYTE